MAAQKTTSAGPPAIPGLQSRVSELESGYSTICTNLKMQDASQQALKTALAELERGQTGIAGTIEETMASLSGLDGKVDQVISESGIRNGFPQAVINEGSPGFRQSGNAGGGQVDSVLRELLGRTPPSDGRGIIALLTRSFSPMQEDGNTVWLWNRNPGAGLVDFSSGGITAAQKVLQDRITPRIPMVLQRLAGLEPIRANPNEELVGALLGRTVSQFETLAALLTGRNDLIPAQADLLFAQLGIAFVGSGCKRMVAQDAHPFGGPYVVTLNPHKTPVKQPVRPEDNLEAQLGMYQNFVETLEEEAGLADFELLKATMMEIATAFADFLNDENQFLSSKVFNLSRRLLTVVEDVDAVESAMDTYGLGPQRREVTDLVRDGNGRMVRLGGLLRWIRQFCTEDAGELLAQGGKPAGPAIHGHLEQLHGFVKAAGALKVPAGFAHRPVQRVWAQLACSLEDAWEDAGKI